MKTDQAVPAPSYPGGSLWDELDDAWPILACILAIVPVVAILRSAVDNDLLLVGIAFVLLGPVSFLRFLNRF